MREPSADEQAARNLPNGAAQRPTRRSAWHEIPSDSNRHVRSPHRARTEGNDDTWPRIPAERDESADTQRADHGAPAADDPLREDMRIAQADLAKGRKDTDERSRASDELMERLRRDE